MVTSLSVASRYIVGIVSFLHGWQTALLPADVQELLQCRIYGQVGVISAFIL